MKLSNQIKSISYLKAHVSEIVRTLSEQGGRMVITRNGEARAVLQDFDSFNKTQETMALLKVLALGNRQIEAGQVESAADAIKRLRERTKDR
ncbi:MAG: type II toxin-antitoxin system Phd/YefM family antitoxin [Gemmatimonadetes bacterium]|nr:type II toxin-antitoxin system Phd/YefM family antitoxin [Gemmatimonadota bacterium]MDE3256425.1 type II toxin-antitoxin system Phd/YefM family antitoxin [Gemmatimonadota bacterium]